MYNETLSFYWLVSDMNLIDPHHPDSGMTFPQECELLFNKLKLLMIAIEIKEEDSRECNIIINPEANIKINPQTQRFFIAQSADKVKRCHSEKK